MQTVKFTVTFTSDEWERIKLAAKTRFPGTRGKSTFTRELALLGASVVNINKKKKSKKNYK